MLALVRAFSFRIKDGHYLLFPFGLGGGPYFLPAASFSRYAAYEIGMTLLTMVLVSLAVALSKVESAVAFVPGCLAVVSLGVYVLLMRPCIRMWGGLPAPYSLESLALRGLIDPSRLAVVQNRISVPLQLLLLLCAFGWLLVLMGLAVGVGQVTGRGPVISPTILAAIAFVMIGLVIGRGLPAIISRWYGRVSATDIDPPVEFGRLPGGRA
jgi:hypothetical protein